MFFDVGVTKELRRGIGRDAATIDSGHIIRGIWSTDMQKSTRTMASALVASAVALGAFTFLGSQTATVRAEEPHKHPKLREADKAIAEAEAYLKEIKTDFHGKKDECLKRLNEARVQISLILADPD
jgi:hypothetical protein